MRSKPLNMLTWGTITAAVSSAAWLSAIDQGSIFCSVGYRATSRALGVELPVSREPAPMVPNGHPGSTVGKRLQAVVN